MAASARWCLRYRWIVVAAWLAALVGGMIWTSSLGAAYSQNIGVTGSDSQQALDLLPEVVPGGTVPDTETIVLHGRTGTVRDAVLRDEAEAMRTRITKLPGVLLATDPYGASGSAVLGVPPISANNRTALMSVVMKNSQFAPDLGSVRRVIAVARGYDGPNLQVEVSGGGATSIAERHLSTPPILAGIFVALIVLCLTVRSGAGVAACAGIAGATAVGVVSIVTVLSRHLDMTTLAPLLAVLLGLGMTLGGAIVVISRMQSGLRAGLEAADAAMAAMTRPGRATVQASLCVALVMVGTLFLRLKVFDGIALAALGAAAVSVLLVTTLLPAMLGICGHHLLGWTERTHLRTTGTALPRRPGFRTFWAGLVHRQPRFIAGAALLALTLLAIPGLGLRLGGSDPGVDPTSMSTRRAYDLISADFFPGLNGPLIVVAQGDLAADPTVVPRLIHGLSVTPGVDKAFVVATNAKRGLAMIQVFPKDGPQATATGDLIRRLRDETVPASTRGTTLSVLISGQNALFGDMAHRFADELPAFLVLELLAIGITVLVRLRSLLLAAAVTATSLLVSAATLGVLTMLFEKARLATMLGVGTGPIEPFLVVFVLIAVLGLSLGMHLCLLSRLREPDTGDEDDRTAIRTGHVEAGHMVLTISLIMLVVFVSVAAQEPRTMKVLGFGLAVGVALDALILRAMLIPALLHLSLPFHPRERARTASATEASPARRRSVAPGPAAPGPAAPGRVAPGPALVGPAAGRHRGGPAAAPVSARTAVTVDAGPRPGPAIPTVPPPGRYFTTDRTPDGRPAAVPYVSGAGPWISAPATVPPGRFAPPGSPGYPARAVRTNHPGGAIRPGHRARVAGGATGDQSVQVD